MHTGIGGDLCEDLERLRATLGPACVVGTWDWDHATGAMVYDAGAAGLLAGDPSLAGRAVYGLATIARVHPADHGLLIERVTRALAAGGPLLVEYRVVAADGAVRWLLSCGRTHRDGAGHPLASRGIVIDVTGVRETGLGEGASLDRAVDLALALRSTLGADAPSEARLAVDLVLISLGRALTRPDRVH